MIVRGKTLTPVPSRIPSTQRKTSFKLLQVTLEEIPNRWYRHFEEMLKKESERMYILRVRNYYGFTAKQLEFLFQSLINMSLFTLESELWGGEFCTKYISQIDKFVNHAFRNGYVTKTSNFKEVISERDKKLWSKILNNGKNAFRELQHNKINYTLRQRVHDYEQYPL